MVAKDILETIVSKITAAILQKWVQLQKYEENQDKVPMLYWLPKLHKNPIKQDLLLILVLVRQKNFLNC